MLHSAVILMLVLACGLCPCVIVCPYDVVFLDLMVNALKLGCLALMLSAVCMLASSSAREASIYVFCSPHCSHLICIMYNFAYIGSLMPSLPVPCANLFVNTNNLFSKLLVQLALTCFRTSLSCHMFNELDITYVVNSILCASYVGLVPYPP